MICCAIQVFSSVVTALSRGVAWKAERSIKAPLSICFLFQGEFDAAVCLARIVAGLELHLRTHPAFTGFTAGILVYALLRQGGGFLAVDIAMSLVAAIR